MSIISAASKAGVSSNSTIPAYLYQILFRLSQATFICIWSSRVESNHRSTAPQAVALSAELRDDMEANTGVEPVSTGLQSAAWPLRQSAINGAPARNRTPMSSLQVSRNLAFAAVIRQGHIWCRLPGLNRPLRLGKPTLSHSTKPAWYPR